MLRYRLNKSADCWQMANIMINWILSLYEKNYNTIVSLSSYITIHTKSYQDPQQRIQKECLYNDWSHTYWKKVVLMSPDRPSPIVFYYYIHGLFEFGARERKGYSVEDNKRSCIWQNKTTDAVLPCLNIFFDTNSMFVINCKVVLIIWNSTT